MGLRDSHVPLPGRCPPLVTVKWHQAGTPRALARSRQLPRQGFYANATCQAGSTQASGLTGAAGSPGLCFPQSPPPAPPEMPSKSLALDSRRGGPVAAEGRGTAGLHERKCHPLEYHANSKVGPRQLEWMAQLGFPQEEGAEGPF